MVLYRCQTAHIDFMIASVVFTQGPLLYFRNMTAVAIQYIPSHEGFEWLYAVALANGLADQVQADGDYSIWSQRVKSMYLAEGGACQSAETPILGQEVKISFLLNCSFELGQAYRIFVLLEDGSNRNDGTLKTLDFVYQGEMTLDSAIPYSHPVPSSDRWRIVPMTSVADWRIQRIRMFSDVTCTHPVDVYPSPYLDPLWSTVQEGDPLPNGAAFSYPGPLSSSNDVFKETVDVESTSQHPSLTVPGFGGGNGDLRVSTKVGCVEVTQSEVTGEFAESLELQYHDGTAFVAYRQAVMARSLAQRVVALLREGPGPELHHALDALKPSRGWSAAAGIPQALASVETKGRTDLLRWPSCRMEMEMHD
eukprot:g11044.t1